MKKIFLNKFKTVMRNKVNEINNNILFNLNFDLPFEDKKLIRLLWLTNLTFLFWKRQSLGEFVLSYKIFIIFIKSKPFFFGILLSKNSIF